MLRAIAIVGAICVAACGRIGFGLGDNDASDAATDGTGDATSQPNVAFGTRMLYDGGFGGLAVADAICANEAAAAGLSGTFVALLSTSTVNARDRLAGSRGWVTTIGQPLADQPADLFSGGRALGVLNRDAAGTFLPSTQTYAWTATEGDGTVTGLGTCSDWTSTTNNNSTVGFYTRSAPDMIATSLIACSEVAHLYCFEVGKVAVVEPVISVGRIAFVSIATSNSAAGLATYDMQCQTEANMYGLPGTFLAAVATTTSSIASRFSMTSRWRRVDGTAVSNDAAHMFDGTWLLASVNQEADGTYLTVGQSRSTRTGAGTPTNVGTTESTCSDWSTTTAAGVVAGSPNEVAQSAFWGNAAGSCGGAYHLLCLQQ